MQSPIDLTYSNRKNFLTKNSLKYQINPDWRFIGKLNYSKSDSSLGEFYGGSYTEAVMGYGPVFFDSTANLYIARADWHVVRLWDVAIEGRMLSVEQAQDPRRGALVAVYRALSDHIKLGAGWNFTDFSDDLTNLSYTHRGAFLNLVAKF